MSFISAELARVSDLTYSQSFGFNFGLLSDSQTLSVIVSSKSKSNSLRLDCILLVISLAKPLDNKSSFYCTLKITLNWDS